MSEKTEYHEQSQFLSIWMNVIGVILLRLDHLKDEITRFASPGRIWLTILSAFGLYFIANAGVYFTLKELEPVHQMLLPALIWTAIRVLVLSLLPFLLACWASQRFLQGNWVLHALSRDSHGDGWTLVDCSDLECFC